MATLKDKVSSILDEKNTKIIPENIKSGVQIFNVIGTNQGGVSDIIDIRSEIEPYDYDNAEEYIQNNYCTQENLYKYVIAPVEDMADGEIQNQLRIYRIVNKQSTEAYTYKFMVPYLHKSSWWDEDTQQEVVSYGLEFKGEYDFSSIISDLYNINANDLSFALGENVTFQYGDGSYYNEYNQAIIRADIRLFPKQYDENENIIKYYLMSNPDLNNPQQIEIMLYENNTSGYKETLGFRTDGMGLNDTREGALNIINNHMYEYDCVNHTITKLSLNKTASDLIIVPNDNEYEYVTINEFIFNIPVEKDNLPIIFGTWRNNFIREDVPNTFVYYWAVNTMYSASSSFIYPTYPAVSKVLATSYATNTVLSSNGIGMSINEDENRVYMSLRGQPATIYRPRI